MAYAVPWNKRSAFTALAKQPVGLCLVVLAIASAIGFLPLTMAATLVAGGVLGFVILIRPVTGLYLLAFAVPFGSLAEFRLAGISISAAEPLVALTLLGWAASMLSRRERFTVPAPVWLVSLFVGVLAFEMTLSSSLTADLKELLRWIELLAVAFVGSNVLRHRGQIGVLLAALLAAGLLESLVGWYQFFFRLGPPAFAIGNFLRAYGTFSQPNPFAGYLIMLWPLAAVLGLSWLPKGGARLLLRSLRRRTWWCGSSRPWITVARDSAAAAFRSEASPRTDSFLCPLLGRLGIAATVFIGIAILMSLSRGAWLGMVVATIVMVGLYDRHLLWWLVCGLVLIVAVVVFAQLNLLPAVISSRLNEILTYFGVFDARTVRLTPENWAVVERMASWQAAWRMFEAHPIFGVGPGHYDAAYALFGLREWPRPLGHAHNYYLNVLAEMGAVGLATYLNMLAGWFVGGTALARQLGTRLRYGQLAFERAVVVGAMGALAAAAVHNGFDNLYVHDMNVLVGLLLATMTAAGRREDRPLVA